MTTEKRIFEYCYSNASKRASHDYLLPAVKKILQSIDWHKRERRIFEIGCGNGAVAWELAMCGYEVCGIDASNDGIGHAQAAYPNLRLELGSAYDPLAERYGQYPVVLSLEVIEHLYDPRTFARRAFALLEAGGTLIVSTPYHGYLKNLVLAVTGRLDAHFTTLWDGGHIKFFSMRTLSTLLAETGFQRIRFLRVGRIPVLAKSMIAIASKPG